MNQEIDKMVGATVDQNKSIKKLLEKNFEMTEEVYKLVKKTNRYLFWQQVFGALKLILIVIPIVLSVIYLPPLMKEIFKQYQDLLGGAGDISNIDTKEIMDMLK